MTLLLAGIFTEGYYTIGVIEEESR